MAPNPLRIAQPDGRSGPRKVNFTKHVLDELRTPEKGSRAYHDVKTPGLIVLVTAAGAKTFYLYRWYANKPERIKIGRYPAVTPEQARTQAQKLNGQIAGGADPAAKRRAVLAEPTLGETFDRWMEIHAKPRLRSWPELARQWTCYLEPWRARQLRTIGKPDVFTFHSRLGTERGPYLANRVRALLHGLFEFATAEGWEHPNPVKGVKKFPEHSRDRFIQPDEIRKFLDAIQAEPDGRLRDVFLLALLTGARRRNVLSAKWVDIDIGRALWTIPAAESKSGRGIIIPLVLPALKIVTDRRAETPADCAWVFPSLVRKGRHLVEPRAAWDAIRQRSGLLDVHFHDIRRTLASWQIATGASLPVVAASLGHGPASGATAVYARLADPTPVRDALTLATTAMMETGSGEPAEARKPRSRKGAQNAKA
jgi:integrase